MTSFRERMARLMADKARRRRGAVVFLCLALVVGLVVERSLRQQGITLTASSDIEVIESTEPVDGIELMQGTDETGQDQALMLGNSPDYDLYMDVSYAGERTLQASDGESMTATVDAPADAGIQKTPSFP